MKHCPFAKGLGWLAKTDRLDALMLARYGALARPTARPPLGEAQARLQALCCAGASWHSRSTSRATACGVRQSR